MTSFWGHFGGSFLTQKWEAKCLVGIFRITVWRQWNCRQTTFFEYFGPVGLKNSLNFTVKWGNFLTFRVTKCDEKSSGDNLSPGSWRTVGIVNAAFFVFVVTKKVAFLMPWDWRTTSSLYAGCGRLKEDSSLCKTKMSFFFPKKG